ncbi:hypothetical protein LSCM1_07333 [Leishmania martiniquensis]|uniref:Uncharacterized protein n=1 Tax=Leishmania martiniquensis TaxID=1580590 RepID=A0A836HRF6_9TRYP|nr:hypothetical protein LSCM1_07333 [Leishmania martiniquensis]
MESAVDSLHNQIRRIQAELLRLGWHKHTGDRIAFPSTPVANLASASDPLDGSPVETIQSSLEATERRAGGRATEALRPPKSVARAPPTPALPEVLGEHDVNRAFSEGDKSCRTSPLTACGGADGLRRADLQSSHRYHGNTARAVALPTHCGGGGTSRAAEPQMFVRYVCGDERDSAQDTDGVPAHASSVSVLSSSTGCVAATGAFEDLIARAWGGGDGAKATKAEEAVRVKDRRITSAALRTEASRPWSREGCAASPVAAPPFTAEVQHPVASSQRVISPPAASVPVSSILSSTAAQPPTATRLHGSGHPFSHWTPPVRAPNARIASLVGADAAYRSSTRADCSPDARCAQGRDSAAAFHAPPQASTSKQVVDVSQRQQRLLRAVQLVDAALHGSSGGSSGGAATKRLDRLHQILLTLRDACGRSISLPSGTTTAELHRLRKRLVHELLLGESAPGVLRSSSTSLRIPPRRSPPSAPQVAIRDSFEGGGETDAHSGGALSLTHAAGDVRVANPSSSPVPSASPLRLASTHSAIPVHAADTSAPSVLPPSPPSPAAQDPYMESQQRFQLEMASLHQAQQRRLQLQRQRTAC